MDLNKYLNIKDARPSFSEELDAFRSVSITDSAVGESSKSCVLRLLVSISGPDDLILIHKGCIPESLLSSFVRVEIKYFEFESEQDLLNVEGSEKGKDRIVRIITSANDLSTDLFVEKYHDVRVELIVFAEGLSKVYIDSGWCPAHSDCNVSFYIRNPVRILPIDPPEFTKTEGQDSSTKVFNFARKISKSTLNVAGQRNTIYIGSEVFLEAVNIRIKGDDNIVAVLAGARPCGTLEISGSNCRILIGSNTFFTSRQTRIFSQENNTSIDMGNDCLVGECTIRTSDSHSIMSLETNKRINPARSVYISARVWIAQGIRILKGVKITHDVVIGSGSLVSKSLESPFSAYAGTPARLLKSGIYWNKDRVSM